MTYLVCGEALYDLFATETPTGFGFDARIGGSPFNVAVGLARLGHKVGLCTGLSTDFPGRRLRAALVAEDVSTDWLIDSDRPTTLSLVGVGSDGAAEYQFLGEGAADRSLVPADIPSLGGVSGLHFGSFSLVVEPSGSTYLGMAQGAAGRFVSVDPNIRPTVEPDLDVWRARVEAFVAAATVVKVSDEDLGLLYPGMPLSDIARRWRSLGPAAVVVTGGETGAHVWSAQGELSIPGRIVAVVDTVGAGDTFQAALIAALMDQDALSASGVANLSLDTLTRIMTFARDAAAITCSRRGADLPRRADLAAL